MPEPIEFSPSIQPIKMSTDCNPLDHGETVIAVGNGCTTFSGREKRDNTLHHGIGEVMPSEYCQSSFHDLEHARDSTICVDSLAKQYAFHGDSGEYCITLI